MSQIPIKCPKCGQKVRISRKIAHIHPAAIEFCDRIQAVREAACTIARMCGELDTMAGAFTPIRIRKSESQGIGTHTRRRG